MIVTSAAVRARTVVVPDTTVRATVPAAWSTCSVTSTTCTPAQCRYYKSLIFTALSMVAIQLKIPLTKREAAKIEAFMLGSGFEVQTPWSGDPFIRRGSVCAAAPGVAFQHRCVQVGSGQASLWGYTVYSHGGCLADQHYHLRLLLVKQNFKTQELN